jgi:hypothetical protein
LGVLHEASHLSNEKSFVKNLNRGLTAPRIVKIGNYMLRRRKHLKIEVVAPEEEEETRKELAVL